MTFRDREKRIVLGWEHKTNPLHIYCRLRKVMRERLAKIIARIYEKTIFRTIFHKLIVAEMRQIEKSKERR